MKTIDQIKIEKENKVSELIKGCRMFFAFSNQQFEENKTPLQEGEKYVAMGAGAYMPKSQVQKWIDGTDAIDKWFKETVKSNKARRSHIAYELNNHEAYYTGTIDDTLDALGEDYTKEEVLSVFQQERKKCVDY